MPLVVSGPHFRDYKVLDELHRSGQVSQQEEPAIGQDVPLPSRRVLGRLLVSHVLLAVKTGRLKAQSIQESRCVRAAMVVTDSNRWSGVCFVKHAAKCLAAKWAEAGGANGRYARRVSAWWR